MHIVFHTENENISVFPVFSDFLPELIRAQHVCSINYLTRDRALKTTEKKQIHFHSQRVRDTLQGIFFPPFFPPPLLSHLPSVLFFFRNERYRQMTHIFRGVGLNFNVEKPSSGQSSITRECRRTVEEFQVRRREGGRVNDFPVAPKRNPGRISADYGGIWAARRVGEWFPIRIYARPLTITSRQTVAGITTC